MGRSSIIYVIGLTLIVGLVLNNISHNSVSSMDTFTTYYGATRVHNIAVSGANVGSSYLLMSAAIPANFGVSFFGGHDSIIFFPNTPKTDWVTLRSVSQVDMLITSTMQPEKIGLPFRDTVEGVFRHVTFAKYSWFTQSETNGYLAPDGTTGPFYGANDWKVTGDQLFGPVHTNGSFNIDGTPYFQQTPTSGGAPNKGPSYNPNWPGIDYPVTIARPTTPNLEHDLEAAATLGGGLFDESSGSKDVALTFNNDQVRIQIPPNGSTRDTTMAISALASNGVIVVKGADVRIKGTYQGDITVAAFGGSAANKGNVWIDGDLVGKTDPSTNPASTDMMGIVAGRMAYITEDDTRSPSSVLNIQAAVYCQNGELTAENFWNIPVSGRVNLFGGVTQLTAGSLGVYNPGPPVSFLNGFSYNIRNDPRYETQQPPFFPTSSTYQLLSWWEN